MNFLKYKAFCLFLVFSTIFVKSDVVSNNTYQLEEANFDKMVQNGVNQNWFVMFHTPWCPHCKRLMPVFEELASNLSHILHFGVVDWYCLKKKNLF